MNLQNPADKTTLSAGTITDPHLDAGEPERDGFDVVLGDGTPMRMAPLSPADRDAMLGLMNGLSQVSRTFRFASPTPRLSPRQIDFLSAIDGYDHVVWGAFLDGSLIGMARWVRFPHDHRAADIAVTVADDHHGRGVGSLLLEALAAVAPRCDVERFGFSVLGTNRKAIRLLARFGARFAYSGGMGDAELPVSAFAVGRLPLAQRRRSAKHRPDQVASMAQILKSTRPASSPMERTSF